MECDCDAANDENEINDLPRKQIIKCMHPPSMQFTICQKDGIFKFSEILEYSSNLNVGTHIFEICELVYDNFIDVI